MYIQCLCIDKSRAGDMKKVVLSDTKKEEIRVDEHDLIDYSS